MEKPGKKKRMSSPTVPLPLHLIISQKDKDWLQLELEEGG